jgi:hypothetical protein
LNIPIIPLPHVIYLIKKKIVSMYFLKKLNLKIKEKN